MIMLAFFSWWYGRGWKQNIQEFERRTKRIHEAFSVSLLLKTLFAPWRRIITPPGATINDKLRAVGDNIVSRVIGFIVRFFVLFGALITIIIIGLATLFEIVLWPLLPPAVPVLLLIGMIGLI
jgi:hypothetical protein